MGVGVSGTRAARKDHGATVGRVVQSRGNQGTGVHAGRTVTRGIAAGSSVAMTAVAPAATVAEGLTAASVGTFVVGAVRTTAATVAGGAGTTAAMATTDRLVGGAGTTAGTEIGGAGGIAGVGRGTTAGVGHAMTAGVGHATTVEGGATATADGTATHARRAPASPICPRTRTPVSWTATCGPSCAP